MTTPLLITVRGTPQPKARPRFVKGRVVSTVKPKEKLWRKGVESAAKAAVEARGGGPLFTGAVRTTMTFTFAGAPHQIGKPHTAKPDKENLEKLVLDAMERAGVYRNDSQVAAGPVAKWWGEQPGATILVEAIDDERAPNPSGADGLPDWLA